MHEPETKINGMANVEVVLIGCSEVVVSQIFVSRWKPYAVHQVFKHKGNSVLL